MHDSRPPEPEIRMAGNLIDVVKQYTPEYDETAMTKDEYIDMLRSTVRDNIILFGKEVVRVRQLLVAIRNATTLNSAKKLAREYMESAGNF